LSAPNEGTASRRISRSHSDRSLTPPAPRTDRQAQAPGARPSSLPARAASPRARSPAPLLGQTARRKRPALGPRRSPLALRALALAHRPRSSDRPPSASARRSALVAPRSRCEPSRSLTGPAPRTDPQAQAPGARPSSLGPTKTLRVSAGDPRPARAAGPRARSQDQPVDHAFVAPPVDLGEAGPQEHRRRAGVGHRVGPALSGRVVPRHALDRGRPGRPGPVD